MNLEDRLPAHAGAGSAASAALVPHPSQNGPAPRARPRDLSEPVAVIDALLDGSLITVSSSGSITHWNRHAQLAFGLEEDEAIGRPLLDVVVAPEHRGPAEGRLAELLSGHYGALRPHRLSIRAHDASGRDLRAALVIMPIALDESSTLSALLAEIASAQDGAAAERIRERHAGALDRLARALDPAVIPREQTEENRVAGVVIVFDVEALEQPPEEEAEVAPEVEVPEPPEAELVLSAPAPSLAPAQTGPSERIRAALEEDRFVLYAQPVLQLASNAVVQHELLLRMTDEDGTLLLPGAFLPAAEAAGAMAEIDAWVTRRAIELIADQEHAGRKLRLEVNVSAAALTSASFALGLEAELAAQEIDPSRLVLEVSESVAAEHAEATSALARRARGLGCRFALDNVGSTFASLRHLKHIAVDYLKVDGSITAGLTESRAERLMLEAIVRIAHGLGAAAIAEWVSDVETVALLREAGVDLAQGYRIGRPLPIGETHHAPELDDGDRY